jgi:hypothetical protein
MPGHCGNRTYNLWNTSPTILLDDTGIEGTRLSSEISHTRTDLTRCGSTIACRNNETFKIFGHFKVRRSTPSPPPPPPWSMLKKVGWIFSFQSFKQHCIGDEFGIYAVVSIIFAPDCRCLGACMLPVENFEIQSLWNAISCGILGWDFTIYKTL